MNCFQKFVSLIFWTTNRKVIWTSWSCELLSKVCIFDILNNKPNGRASEQLVVNCFQKFVSLIFWTTVDLTMSFKYMLWIAFKSLYLWYSEQQLYYSLQNQYCCELLSKVCIFDILNNLFSFNLYIAYVVNCFQKFVSLIFWTTEPHILQRSSPLWIAFKSLYLWYSEQHFISNSILF